MIFLNPWAWMGLVALAAPIAAHLFARRRAERRLFPTLRFIPPARVAPVRRDRLTDLGLLALRCGVVAVAVAALAQPACRARGDAEELGRDIARAVVIDTSPSMSRDTVSGTRAVDAARREAATLASSATIARVVESETPGAVIGAGVNWLATISMRRELVIVSDFQRGQVDEHDLSRVPDEIGIRAAQIPVQGAFPVGAATSGPEPGVTILAGDDERAGAEAAWRAAVARGAPERGASDRPVAIVFPQYGARGTAIANGKPLDRPWMFEVVASVSSDSLSYLYSAGLSWTGGLVNDREGVLLVTDAPADSLAAAALMTAAARAASGQPAAIELSPDVVPPDELARWTREAAPTGSSRIGDPAPQGRWWWAAVLALLLIEGMVRRTGISAPAEDQRERAA